MVSVLITWYLFWADGICFGHMVSVLVTWYLFWSHGICFGNMVSVLFTWCDTKSRDHSIDWLCTQERTQYPGFAEYAGRYGDGLSGWALPFY